MIAPEKRPTRPGHARVAVRAGVTLVELVVVMAILAVWAAIAVPRFASAVSDHRALAAARRVAVDVDYAKRRARINSSAQTIQFVPSTNSYTLVGVQSLDRSNETYVVDLAAGAYAATLVSASLGNDASLAFNGYGVPDSGGNIVLRSGDSYYTVIVDADTGDATVQRGVVPTQGTQVQ